MKYVFLLYPHPNVRYRASLAAIARQELSMTLAALGRAQEVDVQTRGGAAFLTFEAEKLTARDMRMLSQMSSVYVMFRDEEGLAPIEPTHPAYVGEDFPALLKYKGKTNETFTGAMLNMALCASDFMPIHDAQLVVCDPMCGRGTTLLEALRRGYHGVGIDVSRADIAEACGYVTRYLEFHRIKHKKQENALTVRGRTGGRETRFVFSDTAEHFKDGDTRTLRLICGDTRDAAALLKSASAHLIVTDAPYGVQKGTAGAKDGILQTISAALPGWREVLRPGGALAVSFNTNVTRRDKLEEAARRAGLTVVPTEPLAHWVEQAIMRDVLLARREP